MSNAKIKLGNITSLSDARWAAAAGIDFMGFCFDPNSPTFIPPIKAKEIIDWTTGPAIVAEFGKNSMQEIKDISELLNVDFIEINNQLLPDELLALDKPIIKTIDIGLLSNEQINLEINAYEKSFAFNLIASTNHYDCNFLEELGMHHQLIWSLPINPQNANNIATCFHLYAINLNAGFEEKAGLKEFDQLQEIVNAIHGEE